MSLSLSMIQWLSHLKKIRLTLTRLLKMILLNIMQMRIHLKLSQSKVIILFSTQLLHPKEIVEKM
jgi:hypothetical protein